MVKIHDVHEGIPIYAWLELFLTLIVKSADCAKTFSYGGLKIGRGLILVGVDKF